MTEQQPVAPGVRHSPDGTSDTKNCPRYADCGPMALQEFHDHDGRRWDCSAHWTCRRCGYTEHAALVHLKPRANATEVEDDAS